MLRNLVDSTFLLLAVIIIVVLLKDNKERAVVESARHDVEIVRQDADKAIAQGVLYLEGRMNKAEERQDSYQTSTNRKILVLEQKLQVLESNASQSKVVNNNINTLNNNNK